MSQQVHPDDVPIIPYQKYIDTINVLENLHDKAVKALSVKLADSSNALEASKMECVTIMAALDAEKAKRQAAKDAELKLKRTANHLEAQHAEMQAALSSAEKREAQLREEYTATLQNLNARFIQASLASTHTKYLFEEAQTRVQGLLQINRGLMDKINKFFTFFRQMAETRGGDMEVLYRNLLRIWAEAS